MAQTKEQQQLINSARRGGMTLCEFTTRAARAGLSIATTGKVARCMPFRMIVDEYDIIHALSVAYDKEI